MTYPVTVKDFKAFCRQMLYTTTAERNGDRYNFSNMEMYYKVERESDIPVELQSVGLVSYDDATAFALWVGWQLPTEAQWLAASIVDWDTIYEDSIRGYQHNMHRAHIKGHGKELTSTLANETYPLGDYWSRRWHQPQEAAPKRSSAQAAQDVTVRGGPVYCLWKGWTNAVLSYRWPTDCYDENVSFRLVQSKAGKEDKSGHVGSGSTLSQDATPPPTGFGSVDRFG
jgi:hypothetical protein